MPKTRMHDLAKLGQSVWLDNINRKLLRSGRLRELTFMGLLGLTSNPTIFDNAISKSEDYDDEIRSLAEKGLPLFSIYDELTVRDIQEAADLFLPIHETTRGHDGYVSLEINPKLARNARETVEEGLRLHRKVNRANLMLKVPATDEGFPAVEEILSHGINVNVTLIFSQRQYEKTARAYMKGLEKLVKGGGSPAAVHSVASVFVSRIDSAVDRLLDEKIQGTEDPAAKGRLEALKGKAAVANSLLISEKHRELFALPEFTALKEKGANFQRVLWGSTSTKNPAYRDVKYVEELIVKNTVNTIPEQTLNAFLEHGEVKDSLAERTGKPSDLVAELSREGISLDDVCEKLLLEGLVSFEKSFDSLLASLEAKSRKLAAKG
ncbi:MAG: transaldolase [Candidatus Eremiobacteraeota bacterium]|nr:transaldolase [Candidatus Eremiobacteraeota bacterium]